MALYHLHVLEHGFAVAGRQEVFRIGRYTLGGLASLERDG